MIITQRPFLKRDFAKLQYAIEDTSESSPNYFVVTGFSNTIGGGKSIIKFQGNGTNLSRGSEVEIEVLDASGNPVKTEITSYIDRFNNYYAVTSVYDTTAPGIGKVTFVGVADRDLRGNLLQPSSKNDLGYSVVWSRELNIQPYDRNSSELIFQSPPDVTLAQVITPLQVNSSQVATEQFAAVTASTLTILTSNFKGFDQKLANSKGIVDKQLQGVRVDPNLKSSTTNTANTQTRSTNKDVDGGFIVNEVNQYNTIVKSSVPFFSSSYIGGYLEFFTQSYTLLPQTQSNTSLSTTNPYDNAINTAPTLDNQLNRWKSTIVKVQDSQTAYLQTPVQVQLVQQSGNRQSTTTHTYKNVSSFTASVYYTPNSENYTTSTTVSQSYLQFTFNDLKPLAGDIHKVRVFYKRSSTNQDWTLINDQIVNAPEYLTDARYPNQTSYGKAISDYLLQGHFTSQTIANNHWVSYNETLTGFDTTTASWSSTPLVDSINLQTKNDPNGYYTLLATKYYQNYAENQAFTLDFNCTLGPNTELELYMLSDALSLTLLATDYQARAFDKIKNKDKSRYSDDYTRFGKYIGKIKNSTDNVVNYNHVAFDFTSDREGLGRPLFRCKPTSTVTGSAWVSQIGIKPIRPNGYTPEIVQFALQAPADFASLLSESIDYKLEYFNYTGEQSEFVTYLNRIPLGLTGEIPTNGCQSENKSFNFTPQWWVSCSSANALIGLQSLSQVQSQSYSTSTKFYPAFVNGVVGLYLGSQAGYLAQTTPVDGWNCAIPYNTLDPSTTAGTAFFPIISSSINNTNQIVYGAAQGRVTSSWRWYDTFTAQFYSGAGPYPSSVYTYAYATGSKSTTDNARFMSHSCVGIKTTEVSQSYADYVNASTNEAKTIALKRRRLVWPAGGPSTASYFTENGGIYNVKFKLKRDATYDFIPNSGSYLRVFIFNAYTNFTAAARGIAGWYPPDRNIVKIGHAYSSGSVTTPAISWYDSATGYYYDEYDINLIQYGSPAQLVFEPSGENSKYFGTLVDDISFCKIGTTTDPNFIKPTSLANLQSLSAGSQANVPQGR